MFLETLTLTVRVSAAASNYSNSRGLFLYTFITSLLFDVHFNFTKRNSFNFPPNYTVSQKESHLMFDNVDRFSKFFHQLIREEFRDVHTPPRFPPHLQYGATLPRESQKSKNVTDFDSILNRLLTCS